MLPLMRVTAVVALIARPILAITFTKHIVVIAFDEVCAIPIR
jgi:hypothetical protein